MLKKEYKVFGGFLSAPWVKLTFKQVKGLAEKKSEGYVYNCLKRFVEDGLLLEERVGNVILYRLNLSSIRTCSFAGFVAEHIARGKLQIPFSDLERIMRKMPTPYYSLLVSGSYAVNRQKNGSDLDVVVLCDDGLEPKKVYAELRHDCEMNIPPIHLYVFTKSEFLSMLLDDKVNYGKETTKNNVIITGGKEYYCILQEAMRNGFIG